MTSCSDFCQSCSKAPGAHPGSSQPPEWIDHPATIAATVATAAIAHADPTRTALASKFESWCRVKAPAAPTPASEMAAAKSPIARASVAQIMLIWPAIRALASWLTRRRRSVSLVTCPHKAYLDDMPEETDGTFSRGKLRTQAWVEKAATEFKYGAGAPAKGESADPDSHSADTEAMDWPRAIFVDQPQSVAAKGQPTESPGLIDAMVEMEAALASIEASVAAHATSKEPALGTVIARPHKWSFILKGPSEVAYGKGAELTAEELGDQLLALKKVMFNRRFAAATKAIEAELPNPKRSRPRKIKEPIPIVRKG